MTASETQITYMGRRMGGDNKLAHVYWIDGEERWYRKALRTLTPVGTVLWGEVELTDTGVTVHNMSNIKVVGNEEDLERLAAWEAADSAAMVQQAQLRHEKSLMRDRPTPLNNALEVVRKAMRAQRTVADRAAFSRYVDEYIHGRD